MAYARIEVKPYAAALGAEIGGVDLARPLDDATWSEIRDAFHEYLVLFFRDQPLTPAQHVEFARRFGELEPYPYSETMEGFPELNQIVKTPEEVQNFGSGWHTDMSFREHPPLGAVLLGLEVPPVGGDTMWANMYLAYEMLSDGMKAMAERLGGVHDSHEPGYPSTEFKGMQFFREGREQKIFVHPLVRVHPATGRKSLYISPDYCVQLQDMTVEESRPILAYLAAHATRPEFTCRLRWTPNTLAVWDNRCTMHNALEDDLAARQGRQGFRRVMRRAAVKSAHSHAQAA